jgi:two-component system, OmpR family, sensor histidine kinase ChvG
MARRIAIVEDDPAIRQNYRDALSSQGYEVAIFEDRKRAMETFRSRLPDLALLDIGLGADVDGGFALCRDLRSLSPTLPIIFLTARDSDFDVVSGLRMGADDYVTKDVSLPHLFARIGALFRRIEAASDTPGAREEALTRGGLTLDVARVTAAWEGRKVVPLEPRKLKPAARMRAGLRTQLLVVSSLLLAIPFLGLRSAREIEAFLVETQEAGIISTARAVATALNERPSIFVIDSGERAASAAGAFRLETLSSAIHVDGHIEDWEGQPGETRTLVGTLVAPPTPSPEPGDIVMPASPTPVTTPLNGVPRPVELAVRVGRFERAVYLLVDVKDDALVRQQSDFARADSSDGIEIAMVTADDEFIRFAIHAAGDGSPRVAVIGVDGSELPDSRIEASFVETDAGYRVEARLPRTLVGPRLAIAVNDVDDPETRALAGRAGTVNDTSLRENLGTVFTPSPEVAALAAGLGLAKSRIWVLDEQGRVLARTGSLQAGRAPESSPTWRQQMVTTLRPLYRSILIEPTEDFVDRGPETTRLEGVEISRTLTGGHVQWRRRTTDGRAAVLSAAEPVWSDGKVVGAVLVEETTNDTLAARNRAFEQLFFSIALAVFFGALTLLAFATSLSVRIRRLRDAVERVIDGQGRVQSEIPHATAGDEVGDLSRSFASMVERQRQYTAYLEELRGRLSHEIRTPVAVVRSSLDNLRLQPIPSQASVYLDRADEGLGRLVTILQRMTEASRLEQTLGVTDRETFDIARVVAGCVSGYRLANPTRRIEFVMEKENDGGPLLVDGAPDLVAQLLDKLVENALDFARADTAVEVRLTRGIGTALLAVSNEGDPLPAELRESIFDSMISSRPSDGSGRIHLGLGLTIVKMIAEFHRATATVSNRRDPDGVTFLVAFPLAG